MENLSAAKEGKTTAIISYLTIIGTIIALVLNANKKNEFASFHIRQTVGFNLLSMVIVWLIGSLSASLLGKLVSLTLFVLWIIGLIGAIRGERKEMPVIGAYFQDWFRSI